MPDTLWEEIKPILPRLHKIHRFGGGRPRVPDRDAMNAVFFVLRTGCQWNALNKTGLCSSSTAHHRFQQWVTAGVFTQIWKKGLLRYDCLKGINWEWQSMDGAMTKSPLSGEKCGPNPTDRAKQGVKRSLLTEGCGVPIGIAVAGANRNDFKMTEGTIESIPIRRPRPRKGSPQGMCLDKGYDYDEVRDILKAFGYTAHIRARGEEAQDIKKKTGRKARRWVVERTHSWMNRFRGILIRWSKKPENYLALLHLSCAYITYGQAGLLG
ncbi:MAG: IS5 family transposase [Patescibacteria group bacterium]